MLFAGIESWNHFTVIVGLDAKEILKAILLANLNRYTVHISIIDLEKRLLFTFHF